MSKSRWAAAGLLVTVFALGAMAGGIGSSMAEKGQSKSGRGRPGRDGYVERLNAELELSPAQADSVRVILQRYEPTMDSLWRELRPRFDSLRVGVRPEILSRLTVEQQRKYQEMLDRREREYRNRRSNGRK